MKNFEFRISNHEKRTPALLAGVLLLSDQIVKYLFSGFGRAYCNPDGPWGIPADNPVLSMVMVSALLGFWYFFRKSDGAVSGIAFALIAAGGVSNLYDRAVFGCVRDFALIQWFPAFNFSDVFLTIGAGSLFFTILRKK